MLITIITVCYNALSDLRTTSRSVMSQNFDDFEYLVIDGASTDGTTSELELLHAEHLRSCRAFRYLSEPDKGIYDAMNKAAQMALGKWVLYLNAGDTFADHDTLAQAASHLRTTAAVAAYGDTIYDYGHYSKPLVADKPLSDLAKRMIFCHQSVFVRRELLATHPFDLSYKICADFKFFNTLYKEGYPLARMQNLCIARYEARAGLSSRNKAQLAREVYHIRTGRSDFRWYLKYLLVSLRDYLFK